MIIIKMYITLLSSIFAGIVNSIFCKSNILDFLKIPMDFNKRLYDNKRIFGDNKTWKGFFGYIVFNIIFSCIFGNLLIGFLLGSFYALFELPNSLIKRGLDIEPGKTNNKYRLLFIILDQADSIFGVALVVWMFYPIGIRVYLLFIVVGTITHLLINMFLYFLHLRKNMF